MDGVPLVFLQKSREPITHRPQTAGLRFLSFLWTSKSGKFKGNSRLKIDGFHWFGWAFSTIYQGAPSIFHKGAPVQVTPLCPFHKTNGFTWLSRSKVQAKDDSVTVRKDFVAASALWLRIGPENGSAIHEFNPDTRWCRFCFCFPWRGFCVSSPKRARPFSFMVTGSLGQVDSTPTTPIEFGIILWLDDILHHRIKPGMLILR